MRGGDGDRTKVVCVLCVTYVLFGEHRQFFQIHNLATGKVRWGRSVSVPSLGAVQLAQHLGSWTPGAATRSPGSVTNTSPALCRSSSSVDGICQVEPWSSSSTPRPRET